MPEPMILAAAAVAGAGLGGIHYGGLWATVRGLPAARRPAALWLISFGLRMGATGGGFYLVAGGRWERLLACLAGFLVVRAVLVGRVRRGLPPSQTLVGGVEPDAPESG